MKSCLPALAFTLCVITGCTTPPPPEPAPQPERLSQQVARTTLERAQQAYDEGDYARAISTLKSGGVSVFDGAEPATRLDAMKLEAFSYCVANQVPECRAQFRKILDAFPNFDLNVAERKHPVWGPAFEAAKRMKR
ncbi:TssQ family T6SS-associated lipoprotein [Variovorax sp. efr-133-TYG-130]|uniref:TssQ family T6SS-associated lipoprotein n=1 Tax=Variovorax sp. efr-133-TYG-130 TaxID=3040327 RepID=UPI0025535E6C|nr:TssQ family T6SS-associated lipoprotein [Variovorax sp. efr-133-TYG-130]